MATQTLRPNGTVSAAAWNRTGGTTKHGVLADDADATYLTVSPALDDEAEAALFSLTTYTLAAGERVKRVRSRIRASHDGAAAGDPWVEHLVESPGGTSTAYTRMTLTSSSPSDQSAGWSSAPVEVASQQATVDALRSLFQGVRTAKGNAARVYEVYVDLDVWQRTDAPTVTSDPSGTITDTDVPTIQSYTANLNDGSPSLYSRQVRVFRDAVYLAGGFDPETETDVEWEQTDTSLGSVSTPSSSPDELTVGEPLANSDTYRAYVRYGKNDVAGQTLWSDWGYVEFTLNLTLPTAPTVTVSVDEPGGRQTLTVTTAALTHDTLERLQVERSDDGGTTWATIRDGLTTDVAASTAYTFHDYDAPRSTTLQYRARVTEGITASGTTLTSDWTTSSPVAHPNDGQTWLYDVDTWEQVDAYRVLRGTSRQPAEQQGVFYPLGRTTAVVVTAGRTADMVRLRLWSSDHGDDVDAVETLATSTGKLLVKWSDGTQEYLRVTSRTVDVQDLAGGRRRTWDLQAVQVASGITSDG